MKRFLKFLFNLARNLSLIFVILLLASIFYTYKKGDLDKLWQEATKMEPEDQEETVQLYARQHDNEVELFEEKTPPKSPRPTHLIRPEEMAFFYKPKDEKVYAVNMYREKIDEIRSSVLELCSALEKIDDNPFFCTSSTVINCRMVKQYYSENARSKSGSYYKHFVVMETGDTLSIPKDKFPALKKKLEQYALLIE